MNNEIGTDLASKMVSTFRRQVTPMVVEPMIDEPTKRGVHIVFDLIRLRGFSIFYVFKFLVRH